MRSDPSSSPPPRPPLVNLPSSVLVVLIVLLLVHLWRLSLDETADLEVLLDHGFVPARLTIFMGWDTLDGVVSAGVQRFPPASRDEAGPALRAILGEEFAWSSLLTYSVLHQGWAHLLTNAAFLAAFGRMVALRFGAGRFLLFTAATSVCAVLGHWIGNLDSYSPVIGASGAVAGLMGGCLRFIFADGVAFGPAADLAVLDRRLSLRETFRNRRAVAFSLVLLGSNALIGLGVNALMPGAGAVAWLVHLAGFASGLLLFPIFDPVTIEADHRDRR